MSYVIRVDLLEGEVVSTTLSDGQEFPCTQVDFDVDEHVKDVNDILRDYGNVFICYDETDVIPKIVKNVYTFKSMYH